MNVKLVHAEFKFQLREAEIKMEIIPSGSLGRIIILGLQTGDDILRSIVKAIKERKIKNGIIISVAGSLRKIHYHYVVQGPNEIQPVKDVFETKEGYIEILGLQGIIADEVPHLHINCSVNDVGFGGHLELGSEVLTVCEIAILTLPEAKLERIKNKFRYPVIQLAK